ncbi:hypothetical protein LEP1GSC158_2940 [Leptospira interrogans serovar Zanoni str. LT2156]|uniref:Uncharacterized protein n=1 Tax=Leptospira interrogans serovar Zanoni str. LT2156 TaxID=1001601 RepID=M6HQ01_LEPIR|nr:hypothetical protein LEP1GSC158_2940 [Leptospira interrogans serovar Zanoni str. LT2156]
MLKENSLTFLFFQFIDRSREPGFGETITKKQRQNTKKILATKCFFSESRHSKICITQYRS